MLGCFRDTKIAKNGECIELNIKYKIRGNYENDIETCLSSLNYDDIPNGKMQVVISNSTINNHLYRLYNLDIARLENNLSILYSVFDYSKGRLFGILHFYAEIKPVPVELHEVENEFNLF